MLQKNEVISLIENLLNEQNKDNIDVKLYMVEKLKNKHYYFHRPILENNMAVGILKSPLRNVLKQVKESFIGEFNPIGKQDNTIETIAIDSIEAVSTMNNDMGTNENINVDMNQLDTSNLSFYMIEIKHGENKITLFRRYTGAKTLKKRALPLRIFDNTLTRVSEELFFIDDTIDVVALNDENVIIFNRYSFEVIMNYKDNYIDNLELALDRIEESELIDNFTEFKEDCQSQMLIAKKFTNIMKNRNLDVIINNLNKVGNTIQILDLPINFKDNKIVYEDKSQIYVIIEVLSDNFAKTLIGNQSVNVPIKNPINN